MEDRFFKAVFAPEARICGRWVPRLTLWHELLLHSLGSPFVRLDGEVRAEDVLRFLRVVECEYPEQPDFRWCWRDVRWRRRMSRDVKALRREAETIAKWRAEVESPPEFWAATESKGHRLTGPPVWVLAWRLVTSCRYALKDAMNESLGRAWWSVAQVEELGGYGRRFAWESDGDRVAELPNLLEASEEEIAAQVRRDMSPRKAEEFLERRRRSGLC